MSNLHQETEAARRLIEMIRADHPDDDDLLHDMVEGETDLLRIMDWISNQIGMDEASIAANRKYRDELAGRAERLARRVESNRRRLADAMDVLGMKKMELVTATLSRREGKQKLVIDDEEKLPANAYDLKPTLNKQRLRDWLDEGRPVDGVHLSNAEPSLTIRRK